MKDDDCVDLLRFALPRLGLRWDGFRRVRRGVCKRVDRRVRELGLSGIGEYRSHLEAHPEEWTALEALCRVSISRFYRDRAVFDRLRDEVLPALAAVARAQGAELRCWSAGCASGEESYTLAMLWHICIAPSFPETHLRVIATDVDPVMLARARDARYSPSSLKELPRGWLESAFERSGSSYRVRPQYASAIEFLEQDLRVEMPEGLFHLCLCRNVAFTYFDEASQSAVCARIAERLAPGGALVIGSHERLPREAEGFSGWAPRLGIYRRDRA